MLINHSVLKNRVISEDGVVFLSYEGGITEHYYKDPDKFKNGREENKNGKR